MTVRSRTMTVRSRTAGLPATCEVAPLTQLCLLAIRNCSAIQFKRIGTVYIFSLFMRGNPERMKKLKTMPHTKTRNFKPPMRLEPTFKHWQQTGKADSLTPMPPMHTVPRTQVSPTCNLGRSVASFQDLSSRNFWMRGKRMEMPSAVWISALLNSAPMISHTGALFGSATTKSGTT